MDWVTLSGRRLPLWELNAHSTKQTNEEKKYNGAASAFSGLFDQQEQTHDRGRTGAEVTNSKHGQQKEKNTRNQNQKLDHFMG